MPPSKNNMEDGTEAIASESTKEGAIRHMIERILECIIGLSNSGKVLKELDEVILKHGGYNS